MKENVIKILKGLIRYILVFIILIGIYFALLTLSSLIPSSALEKNVRSSSEILIEEGERVTFDLGYKEENIFTFTDALMINTAYSVDNTHPIESSILARKNYIPGQTKEVYPDGQYNLGANEKYINKENGDLYQTQELYGLMHGDNIEDSYEYARYWHGYLSILRPLLTIFDYSGIRVVLFILTLVSIVSLVILICRKINVLTGIIYIIGLLSISIFIITKSLNESLIFLVAFISSIYLLLRYRKIKNIGVFFFIVGSISSFIDLLTAPLVTLGITAITYFLIMQKNEENVSIKKYILEILKIGIAWTLGYGITWASKWLITELIFNRPIISQAIEQASFRSNVPKYKGEELFGALDVIERNLEFLSTPVSGIIFVIFILFIIIFMIKNSKKNINFKENLKNCVPFIIIFFFPIIWYLVLKQHSYTHVNFTYRLLIISIISLLVVSSQILKEDSEKITIAEKEKVTEENRKDEG